MEIHSRAFNHGCKEADIRYAYEHARVRFLEADDRTWFVGFDLSARLLELLVPDADSDEPLLIHADKARAQFVALL